MDQVRFESRLLHPEVHSVTRESVQEALTKEKMSLPYYTKYEQVKLLGVRAQQLEDGAKPLVSLDGMLTSHPNFVSNVAKRELMERKLPFIFHRRFPDGRSEYWSAMDLSVIW